MDKQRECPPPNTLADLIQGKMIEPELSELSLHLEECSVCQQKARTLSPYDTLIESLRGEAPAEDKLARNVPRPLIERLKQIPKRDSSIRSDTGGLSPDPAVSPAEQELDFLAPAQEANEIGRLGHYRILKVLGMGGMGAVFLAEDPKLDRQVALKVMLPKIAANPRARDRFLREARAAAKLKSEYIVTIYQVDETNGVPYLAMELLEGQSLDDLLHAGQPLGVAEIVHVARDIARGLAAAHEKGLVHRDIKPANLWVEGEPGASSKGEPGALATGGRVKILDFGLAHADKEDVRITQSGAIVGTPAYMAPEQARGDKSVDARADLFSLGCVLYRLCAGDIPFKAETTMGTLVAIALNDPVAPSRLNVSIPPELSGLIMQLLEKDPDRRPQSARDVIARLTEIERSLSGVDTRAPITPPRQRGPLVLWLVGVLLATLIALAGVIFFWQTPDGQVVRIECDDPSIQIAFAGGELKVAGAYKEPITLKPGKIGLKILRKGEKEDDFVFETDRLVVSKGDKIVLRVEVVEGKVQIVQAGKGVLDAKELSVKPAPPAVADADRQAAEWALSLGGTVQVDGREVDIRAATELPKDRFALTRVNLRRIAGVTDAGLAHLQDLKALTRLEIDNAGVSDAGLAHLQDHKGLTWLDISGTKVTDAGLAHLKELKALTRLVMDSTAVTDAGLAQLKDHKALTVLVLAVTKVTDEGLAHLQGLQGLKDLSLHGTRVSDAGLGHLKDHKGLVVLNLSFTQVTDAGLGHLRALTSLTTLHLRVPSVTDAGLAHLKDLKGLTWLDVKGTKVTTQGLEDFHAAVPRCKIIHDGGTLEPKQ